MQFGQLESPQPPPRSAGQRVAVVVLAIVVVLLGTRILGIRLHGMSDRPAAESRPITARGNLADDEQSTIALFEASAPSVVYVSPVQLRQDFFMNVHRIPAGTGSGFIWDDLGHVITNFHVVRAADECQVTLADGTTWNATLSGVAVDKDIAVLQVGAPPASLRPIPVGESKNLRVGQKVFAIGNPFGLDFSLTTGVVSALNRQIESLNNRTIDGVIQTDAAINPGNSGGPLLDSAGRLIGMNTAIYSPSGSSAGIGFAVPVDTINRVVPDLITHGKVIRPGLGANIAGEYSARLGLPGVMIVEIPPDSAAAKAGLRGISRLPDGSTVYGDIILKVEDQPTPGSDELLNALEKFEIGQTVTLTILRGGQELQVPVTLQPLG